MIDIEQGRQEIVIGIADCLRRLGASSRFLTLEQRLGLAEMCRDLADELDRGRIYRPRERVVRRLVRTNKRENGRPLYRIV
jgi:hypothetical protein